jgi:hypothetical protein
MMMLFAVRDTRGSAKTGSTVLAKMAVSIRPLLVGARHWPGVELLGGRYFVGRHTYEGLGGFCESNFRHA